jgi:hypothetical protein
MPITVPGVDLTFNVLVSNSDFDLTVSSRVESMRRAVLRVLGLSDDEETVQYIQIERLSVTSAVAAERFRVRRVLQDDTVTYKVSMEVIIAPNTNVSTWDQMLQNDLNDALIEEDPQDFADLILIVEEVSAYEVELNIDYAGQQNDEVDLGLLIGLVVGGVVLALILVVVVIIVSQKNKSKQTQQERTIEYRARTDAYTSHKPTLSADALQGRNIKQPVIRRTSVVF